MFRFTIRELVVVTLVVALALGWLIDRWRVTRLQSDRDRQWRLCVHQLFDELGSARSPREVRLSTPEGQTYNYLPGPLQAGN